MDQQYTLLDVLKVLGKWKKQILLTTAAVGVVSIIGSLTMDNYYQSTAIVYAAHPDLSKPDPVGESSTSKFIYGTGEDMDRLFSAANSTDVSNHLVEKFDLYNRYKIDREHKKGPAKMAKKLAKLFTTERTKFDAMSISIEDKDPQVAMQMATAVREKISEKVQQVIKQSQQKTLKSTKANIDAQESALATIIDSLVSLKKNYGIYDSATQGEVYAQLLTATSSSLDQKNAQLISMQKQGMAKDSIVKVKAFIAGLKGKKTRLETSITDFNKGILPIQSLEQGQRRLSEELSLEKQRYQRLKASFETAFTTMHVIEQESVPVDKSRPKRSILVLGFTLMGFVLASLVALLVESTKNINWREIYNG